MRQPFGSCSMTRHDFPGPRPDSMTFQARKICILNFMTFQDLYTDPAPAGCSLIAY